ncbi:uncharacterized protein LOC129608117 [Condylostylus longicornis]|uniref:uncharacterized protein LOC129608117 n=1 Tax=Condylostylus longicornis TaxID=2530218 RepID=UPI00244DE03C|nr:uncharacterized protein LOC129608117 [Condylostylus longicornis]
MCTPKIKEIFSYKYVTNILDDRVISPCDGREDIFVDKLMDLSNLSFSLTQNDIIGHGVVKFIKVFPPGEKFQLRIVPYVKKQGFWVRCVFSVYRPDLCASLLKPNEVWHNSVKPFEEELKVCPPEKGVILDFTNLTCSITFEFSDRNLVGSYKVVTTLVGNKGSNFCVQILMDLNIASE